MPNKSTILPRYLITLQPNGDVAIDDNYTKRSAMGNLYTDKKLATFCNERALASSMKFCVPEERDKPTLMLITTIMSTDKDQDGDTIVYIPKNPFLTPFSVTDSDFVFLPGYLVTYKDTYPQRMEIGDTQNQIIIMKHYQKGWVSKNRYEYYELNNMSRAIYDLVIKGSNHDELYKYLKSVEILAKQPRNVQEQEEKQQETIALVNEYKNVIQASIMRSDALNFNDLTHPECVKKSVVMDNPWRFIPNWVRAPEHTL